MSYDNSDLVHAFRSFLRDDALQVASVLPQPSSSAQTFSACVSGEVVHIPYRIYCDPELIDRSTLTEGQGKLLDCLLTRHHNGFIREEHLARIICTNEEWIPPFVVQLVGEYVVEILQMVRNHLDLLDPLLYGNFLRANPRLFSVTKQRVISYWDCYYRGQRAADYAGFQIIAFMKRLVATG